MFRSETRQKTRIRKRNIHFFVTGRQNIPYLDPLFAPSPDSTDKIDHRVKAKY